MAGFVYILRSASTGTYYNGSAVDPDRRLREHNGGHVRATRGRGPWKRVALLRFDTAAHARLAELWLKKLRRGEYLQRIIDGQFAWPDRFGYEGLVV